MSGHPQYGQRQQDGYYGGYDGHNPHQPERVPEPEPFRYQNDPNSDVELGIFSQGRDPQKQQELMEGQSREQILATHVRQIQERCLKLAETFRQKQNQLDALQARHRDVQPGGSRDAEDGVKQEMEELRQSLHGLKDEFTTIRGMYGAKQAEPHISNTRSAFQELITNVIEFDEAMRNNAAASLARNLTIILNRDVTIEEAKDYVGDDQVFAGALMSYDQSNAEISQVTQNATARNRQMKEILQQIRDLQDLQAFIEQEVKAAEEPISKIETALVQAKGDAISGVDNLEGARKSAITRNWYKRKTVLISLIIVLILVIAGAIVAGVLVANNKNNNKK